MRRQNIVNTSVLRVAIVSIVVGFVAFALSVKCQSVQQQPTTLNGITFQKSSLGTSSPRSSVYTKPDANGGFILYGSTATNTFATNQGLRDAVIYKLSANGTILWSHQYGSAGDEEFTSISLCPNGDIIVGGFTEGNLFGMPGMSRSWFMARFNSSGTLQSTKLVSSSAFNVNVLDTSSTRIIVKVTVPTTDNYIAHLELYDYAWNLVASNTQIQSSGYQFIAYYGSQYLFLIDRSTIVKYNENLEIVNQQSIQNAYLTDCLEVNGQYYTIGTVAASATTVNIVAAPISTGILTTLVSLPITDNNYNFTVSASDCSGAKARFIVTAQGTPGIQDAEQDRTKVLQKYSSVYETDIVSTSKLFDAYTAPCDIDPNVEVIRRSDGSFVSITCWDDFGFGGLSQLGTVVGVYGSNGSMLGWYNLPEYTESTYFNEAMSIMVGMQNSSSTDERNSYYATLPNVATPTFSPAAGTYTGTQSVSISCGTAGATIRYTTDGSEPTETSTQYTAPISVSTNKTVKARAFKTATLPSLRSDAAYTIRKTISGTLTLGNYGGSTNGLVATMLLRRTDGTTLQTSSATLNSSGAYSFLTEYEGSMELRVTVARWLKKKATLNVTGNTTCSLSLINGDADGGNSVNLFDYTILDAAYGTSPGDPGWNIMADLDGSNSVNSYDYTVIDMNFGSNGDN